MRLVIFLMIVSSAFGADVLNFSGRSLPRDLLGKNEAAALSAVVTAADAIRLLDATCVVREPDYREFLGPATDRDWVSTDTSARISQIIVAQERERNAARDKARRLTKALLLTSFADSAGLATQQQLATSLRTVLRLAVSSDSGIRLEAQTWVRSQPEIQVAIDRVFFTPRKNKSPEFVRAAPALDYLLNKTNTRSEDSFRALEQFIARFLS